MPKNRKKIGFFPFHIIYVIIAVTEVGTRMNWEKPLLSSFEVVQDHT